MAEITFEDKVATREAHLPRKNDITADDINEIKRVVNENAQGGSGGNDYFWTVDLRDHNEYSAIAPFDMKATALEHVTLNPTFTVTVNGFPLVLGDPVSAGANIMFSVVDSTVFNFVFEKIQL